MPERGEQKVQYLGRRQVLKGLLGVLGLTVLGGVGYKLWGSGKETAEAGSDIEKSREGPIAQELPTPTPEPTLTPAPTPVEAAIKEGKIEIREPQEWEKYFIAVTPDEAEELLKNSDRLITYTLPFDPRLTPELIMGVFGRSNGVGIRFKNLPEGIVLYAPMGGIWSVSKNVTGGGSLLALASMRDGQLEQGIILRRESAVSLIPEKQSNVLRVGTPLIRLESQLPLNWIFGNYQVGYLIEKEGKGIQQSLSQFLTKDGKIAFIDS